MTAGPVGIGLLAQIVLAGLTVVAVIAAAGERSRNRAGALGSAAVGLSGLVTGVGALAGATGGLRIPVSLPFGTPLDPLTLSPDALGGVFMAVSGGVGTLAALYGLGYATGPVASRTAWSAFALFLLGLQLVPAAGDAVSLLLVWETMALASTVLVLAESTQRAEVRSAALWYAVMTHLSFVCLLAGFAVLATDTGHTAFPAAPYPPPDARIGQEGGGSAGLAFVLLGLGFVTKAGVVPLHVWLPRAHPQAPSHVSAVMSAAMVKAGVYGMLLLTLRLLPGGPRWWGVALLVLAAASALYGILQASVASDLKRLLAYSTTENVGLMLTAVAVAMLLRSAGQGGVADVALTACLLLVVSHAAFKTVLFLGAGAILHGTGGERDLDRLGGLRTPMPMTATAFAVGCLGAAALPVTSGFVAEWMLLQALIHGNGLGDRLVAVSLPLTVSVVALTAGLALLTFVKAYGTAFLARPRSQGAANAHEAGPAMRGALLAGAAAVVLLGLAPGPLSQALAGAVGASGVVGVGLFGVGLPAVDALLDPIALSLLTALVAVPVLVTTALAARRRPRRDVALAWGCGGVRVSPRMQYTATSYAEPLVRVFGEALRPQRDLDVVRADSAPLLVEKVEFRQRLGDVVEDRLYRPALARLLRAGVAARRVHNGSIHRYLGFSFAALAVLLAVVTVRTW